MYLKAHVPSSNKWMYTLYFMWLCKPFIPFSRNVLTTEKCHEINVITYFPHFFNACEWFIGCYAVVRVFWGFAVVLQDSSGWNADAHWQNKSNKPCFHVSIITWSIWYGLALLLSILFKSLTVSLISVSVNRYVQASGLWDQRFKRTVYFLDAL